MANKKNDLDDFDFDDDMFGDMNFGDDDDNGVGKAAKKKHPIRTMSTSFAGGAASAMMSTSALKSFTRAALPKGYTSALEAGEDVFGAASNLYHDAVKELEPAMPAIRKAAGMLYDKAEGILPKSIAESMKRFAEHEDYKGRSQADEDDAKISDDLAEIFKAQSTESAKRSAKDRSERYMRYSVQDKQTALSIDILSKIASGTNRLVAYQDRINYKYQQKTLENQYRQTFFLRDILKIQGDQFSLLKEGIEKIVLNTALSDAQKQKSESTLGSKFGTMVSGAASHLTKNMAGKLLKDISSNMKGALGSAVEMISGISDAAEVMDEMGGMHKGGKSGLMAEQMGAMATQFLIPHLALPFQKLFGKSVRGMRGGSFLENMFSQTAAKVNRWKHSESEGDGGWRDNLLQAVKDLMPGMEQEKYVGGSMLTTADKATPFDKLTRRSIVEIIPGYLSRILSETSTIRAGLKFKAPDDSKRTVYNLHKGQFTSFDVALKDTQDSIVSEDSNFRLQQSVNKAVDFIDDGTSSGDYRLKLSQFLALNSSKMTVMDKNFFRDSVGKELFTKTELERTKELFKKKFVNDMGEVDYQNINEFEKIYSPIQHDIADPTTQLRHVRNSGGGEFLDKLSYVGREGNLVTINHDEALRLQMTGKGVEAKKKKEYEFLKNLVDIPKSWWAGKADAIANKIYENPVYQSWSEATEDFVEFTMVRFWKYASALMNGRSFADIDDEDIDDMFEGFAQGEIDYAVANNGVPHTGDTPLSLVEVDTARQERKRARKQQFDTAIDSGKQKATSAKQTLNKAAGRAKKAAKGAGNTIAKSATNVSQGYREGGIKGAASAVKVEANKAGDVIAENTKRARKEANRLKREATQLAKDAHKRLSKSSDTVMAAYRSGGLAAALEASKAEGRAYIDDGKDLYTKGSKGATLFAKKLAAGEYRDQFSDEVLKSWDDIKGNVVDSKGRIVLSAKKMREGIYNEHGELIDAVTLAAQSYIDAGHGMYIEHRDKIMQTEIGQRAAAGMRQGLDMTNRGKEWISGKLEEYKPGITEKLSNFFNPDKPGDGKPDGQRAQGGPVQAGKAYIVGERQPEIFVPDVNGQIIPDTQKAFQHSASMNDKRPDTSAAVSSEGDARLDHLATLVELNTRHLMLTDGIFHQMQKSMMPVDADGKPLRKVGRWSGPIDVLKGMGGGTLAGARGFGKYLSTMYGLQMGALTGAAKLGWTVTSGTARGIKNLFFKGRHENASDIYVKGNMKEPVLLRKHMIDGHYLDVNTNKPIKKVDDITGPVKDVRDGNIVLSQEEYDQGITDNIGKRIGTGIAKGLRSIGSAFASYTGSVFALPFKLARTALNFSTKAVEMINEGQDVYIKGQLNKVALYNKWIKEGRYFTIRNGKTSPVRSYRDVAGETFYLDETTKEKHVVITAEEFANPAFALVDYRGKKLQTLGQKGLGLLGGLADVASKSAVGLVKGYAKVIGAGLGLGRDLLVGTARGIGNFFNPKRRGLRGRIESVDERQYQVLEDILGILMDRLPAPKVLREGSWEMQFRKRKEDAEKKLKEKKDKDEKNGGLFGGLKSLFGKGKKGLLGLLGLGGDEEDEDEDDDSLLDDGLDAVDTAADLNSLRGDKADPATAKARKREAKRLRKLRRKGLRGRALRTARRTGRGARGKAGLLRRGWQRLRGIKGGAAGTAARGVGAAGAVGTAGTAAAGASRLGSLARMGGAAKGLGVAGAVLGAGLAGKELWDINHDETLTAQQQHEASVVAGGTATGGLAGGAAGAALGASVGSVVPIVGTAIGGLIGGGIGYWMGSESGKALSEKMKEKSWGEIAMNLAMPWTIPASMLKNYIKSKFDLKRDEPFRKYRMLQYGIDPSNTDQLSTVLQLEELINRAIVFGPEGAQFDAKRIDVEEIFNLFECGEGGFLKKTWGAAKAVGRFAANYLNPMGLIANAMGHGLKKDDNPNLSGPQNAVCAWFNKRFKPIYLSWKTVVYNVTEKKVEKLQDAWDRTDAEQRKKILNQLTVDSGLYALDTSPFPDGKLITSTRVIEAAKAAALAAVDQKPGSTSKAGWRSTLLGGIVATMAKGAQRAAGAFADKFEAIDKAMPTWMKFTPIGAAISGVSKLGAWAMRALESGAEKIAGKAAPPAQGMKPGEQITAMMAARYKAYGLKDMSPERVNTLYIMERTLVEETRVSGKSEASIDKSGKEAYSQFSSLFGLQPEDTAARDTWIDWFKARFMPVFLTYVAGVRQIVPSGDLWAAEKSMTPVQRILLCKSLITAKRTVNLVFKAGVWTYITSPWDGKDNLNGDPKSVMENVYVIQKEANNKSLPQQTATEPKEKSDQKSTAPPPVPPAKSQDPIANPGATGSANDRVGGGDDDAYARMQQQDSTYWSGKGVDAGSISMKDGRISNVPLSKGTDIKGMDADGLWRKVSPLIASGESMGGNYDAQNGVRGNVQPGLSKMTIGAVLENSKVIGSSDGNGPKTGAAGKYQFIPKTLIAVAKMAGLKMTDLFSPENQERMGRAIFDNRVSRGIKNGVTGILDQLAMEWASLPSPSKGGASWYAGVAGNVAHGGAQRLQELIDAVTGSTGTGASDSGGETGTSNVKSTAGSPIAKADSGAVNNGLASAKKPITGSAQKKPSVSTPAKPDPSTLGFFGRAGAWVDDRVSQTVAGAKQLASDVVNGTTDAASSAGNAIADRYNQTVAGAKQLGRDIVAVPVAAYNATKNAATTAGTWAGDRARQTYEGGKLLAQDAMAAPMAAARWVGNKANETYQGGRQLVMDAGSAAANAGRMAWNGVKWIPVGAYQAGKSAVNWTGDRINQTVQGGKLLMQDAGHLASNAADLVWNGVTWVPRAMYHATKDAATAAGTWVGNTARNVTNAVTNASLYALDAVADTAARAVNAIGSSMAAKAASFARTNAAPRSVKMCARYVANALEKAGFKFDRQESAWMYWKNGVMEKMGFRPVPQGTKAQVGDVMVFDRSPAHKHGHIQIFDGGNWVSDFVQRSWTPYKDPPPCCLFRHSGAENTADNKESSTATSANETVPVTQGPVDIANPNGIAQAAPVGTDQTLSDSSGRDTSVRNAQQQANYQQSVDQRRDQLAGDDIRQMISDQKDIQQRQLDTQVEMSGKLSEQIEKLTQIADAVGNIQKPATSEESSATDTKDMRGPTRLKPPFESRPARSPLNVVRSVIRHA